MRDTARKSKQEIINDVLLSTLSYRRAGEGRPTKLTYTNSADSECNLANLQWMLGTDGERDRDSERQRERERERDSGKTYASSMT